CAAWRVERPRNFRRRLREFPHRRPAVPGARRQLVGATEDVQVAHFLHRAGLRRQFMKMKTTLAMLFVCAAMLYPPALLWAHHAMVAEFNLSKPITVKGTLTQMEWMNPHGWIHVDVKGPDGRVESWAFETGSPFRMEKRGLKKTDFKVGSEVILSGFAAKDGKRSAAGMTITFPDREASFPDRDATFLLGR